MHSTTLINLPNDVLQLIIQALLANSSITPRYSDEDFGYAGDMRALTTKHTEYYGEQDDENGDYIKGLLSWSASCHHFRALLAPYVFRTVVVRDRPKSMASVRCLMGTGYWKFVERLVFAATHKPEPEEEEEEKDGSGVGGGENEDEHEKGNESEGENKDEDEDENGKDSENEDDNEDTNDNGTGGEDMDLVETETENKNENGNEDGDKDVDEKQIAKDLREILSHLPPNLQTLVLDFPCSDDRYWDEAIVDSFPPDGEGDSETSPYRLMLRNVLGSVISNDFSNRSSFELKLYNITPYHCLVYDDDRWKRFLGNVTDFTIGFSHYDNGAGWMMNTVVPATDFAEKLGSYFLDHLDRVTSFSLQSDNSWPLGTPEPLEHPTELPLPAGRAWHGLKHVSFKETFLCTQLVEFLVAHLNTIETIELVDCVAPDVNFEDSNDCISWSAFFTALSDAEPSKLTEVNIEYVSRSEDDLLEGYKQSEEEMKRKEETKQILREQEEELRGIDGEDEKVLRSRRQRRILAYCSVHDKYGMIFEGEERNASRFLELDDHEAWVKLVDVMEGNKKATGDGIE